MGYYINPEDCSKEEWCKDRGKQFSLTPPPDFKRLIDGKPHTLVCLVNNGAFTAAAICVGKSEYKAFTYRGDLRFKIFMFIDDEELKQFL